MVNVSSTMDPMGNGRWSSANRHHRLGSASAVQLQGAQGTGLAVGIATFVVGQQRIRLKNREI